MFVNYIRRARTAHGATYYVIPTGTTGFAEPPPSARCVADTIAAARRVLPGIPAAQRTATIRFEEARLTAQERLPRQPTDGGLCLAAIARGSLATRCEGGSEVSSGLGSFASDGAYLAGLVPDGVATVTLRFERAAPAPPATVTDNVVDNVFVVPKPRAVVGPTAMIWRSASGAAIKTIPEPNSGGLAEAFGQASARASAP